MNQLQEQQTQMALPEVAAREIALPADLHDTYVPPTLFAALRQRGPRWMMIIAQQLVRARWQLRGCSELGRWVRVRGGVRVHNEGSIVIRDRVRFRAETAVTELVTWNDGRIEIGPRTTINYGSSISAARLVQIGADCLIGTYVNLMDCSFHNVEDRTWNMDAVPILIGDRVWLGNRCMITKGVSIGAGSVIAACSLVTHDIPPNCLAVGVPARVVKHL